MRKRVILRPSKGASAAAFAMGIVFTCIGIFVVIPGTLMLGPIGLFGLVWTGMAVWITVSHGRYLFGKKDSPGMIGMTGVEIVDEDAPSEQSAEERMRQLRSLYDQRLITQEEYEEKRKEILKEL